MKGGLAATARLRRCGLLCDADWSVIGRNIRDLRDDSDMNQTALAKEFGVSHQMLSKIEHGNMKRSPISYGRKLQKIADALACELEDLVKPRKSVRK